MTLFAKGWLLGLLCFAAAISTPEARAQSYTEHRISLDRIDKVRIQHYAATINFGGCIVDFARIGASIKATLNAANIPFVEGESDIFDFNVANRAWKIPNLALYGYEMYTDAGCFYDIEIKVTEQLEQGTLAYTGRAFSGYVDIWVARYHGIVPPADITSRISELTEEALKQFAKERADDIKRAGAGCAEEAGGSKCS